MEVFEVILLLTLLIWGAIFVNNIIFFYHYQSTLLDAVFLHKKTFEEVSSDLEVIEEYRSKRFESARKKIQFYHNNSLLTKREYAYYREKIEQGIVKLYLGQEVGFKQCYRKLDLPVRRFFIFIFFFIIFLSIT